jgi:hypothetical protein
LQNKITQSADVSNPLTSLDNELDSASALIAEGNFPQAELHLGLYAQVGGQHSRAAELSAQITRGYGLPVGFKLSEKRPTLAPDSHKYLLVRAWGYGFWSDVHHVIGQLFLAELTHRTPVVWWGENSLFRGAANANAFELYFQPRGLSSLPTPLSEHSFYPYKWNHANVFGEAINLWEGEDSRMAAPYFFNRPEDIVVCDFYTTIESIRPWISVNSAYYELTDDEIYALLFDRYLAPAPQLVHKAHVFYEEKMSGRPWVAVHARGSDKVYESPELNQTNSAYWGFVDRIIELNPSIGVFLLTDSIDLHEAYKNRYGDRLVTTSALRSNTDVGIHLQGHSGYELGAEVMIDVLLAIRCDYFVGNKESNVSLAISSIKRWPKNFSFLLGTKNVRNANWFLHKGHKSTNSKRGVIQAGSYTLPKRKVLFYNNWHNGDIHMSRPYVIDLMNLLGDCDYYYYHKNDKKLLADIENLETVTEMTKSDLSIDTWIGQYHYRGMDIPEMAANKSVFLGCNFPHYYAVMSLVYESLGLGRAIKSMEHYIPSIDYEKFYIKNIDTFFSGQTNPSVLISNNSIMSGQAPAVDFDAVTLSLADTFPQISFLLTNPGTIKIQKNNVFYCDEIINSPIKINDLNEISYISTRCKLIVGRSSGPYSFSITEKNVPGKKFVCICNFQKDAWTIGDLNNVTWTNESSVDVLLPMLINVIKECVC